MGGPAKKAKGFWMLTWWSTGAGSWWQGWRFSGCKEKKKDEPLWGLKATDKEDPVEADNKGRRAVAALETIMLMWSWTHWLILM